jgi:hypothetical protein
MAYETKAQAAVAHESQRYVFDADWILCQTSAIARCLTMRLSGRTQACPAQRERKMAKCARDAPALPHHGPLQPMVRGLTATDPVCVHTLLRSLIS